MVIGIMVANNIAVMLDHDQSDLIYMGSSHERWLESGVVPAHVV